MKKISFILHGKHLRKKSVQYEAEKYFGTSFVTEYFITKSSKSAEDLASKITLNGTDYLIAVGGDGTIHEVVNGIMRVDKSRRENMVVGLLPLGSGNDFARTLLLSSKISVLHGLINNNKINNIDVGKLFHKDLHDKDSITYFINIAGTGLDAEVAKRVNEGNKTYGPNFAFFSATIKSFINHKRKQIKISCNEFSYEGDALLLTFANAKYFGSGLGIAPTAKVNDGKLSLTLAGNVSLFEYLKNIFRIRGCKPLIHPNVKYFESAKIKVDPIGEPCFLEADGEFIGKLPLTAEVLHNELKFLSNAAD